MKWQRLRYLFRPHLAIQTILRRWLGIPFSRWLINVLFQRVFRLNADVPFQVHFTSSVGSPENLAVGKNVWKSFALSGGCYIQAMNGISIGDDTIFAPGVKIISGNHSINELDKWEHSDPIVIGNACWIGSNAIILPSVKIGNNCVIGAGAVVTKSFPDGSIIVGNPAKRLLKDKYNHL